MQSKSYALSLYVNCGLYGTNNSQFCDRFWHLKDYNECMINSLGVTSTSTTTSPTNFTTTTRTTTYTTNPTTTTSLPTPKSTTTTVNLRYYADRENNHCDKDPFGLVNTRMRRFQTLEECCEEE